jgi:hypothetical protein
MNYSNVKLYVKCGEIFDVSVLQINGFRVVAEELMSVKYISVG